MTRKLELEQFYCHLLGFGLQRWLSWPGILGAFKISFVGPQIIYSGRTLASHFVVSKRLHLIRGLHSHLWILLGLTPMDSRESSHTQFWIINLVSLGFLSCNDSFESLGPSLNPNWWLMGSLSDRFELHGPELMQISSIGSNYMAQIDGVSFLICLFRKRNIHFLSFFDFFVKYFIFCYSFFILIMHLIYYYCNYRYKQRPYIGTRHYFICVPKNCILHWKKIK